MRQNLNKNNESSPLDFCWVVAFVKLGPENIGTPHVGGKLAPPPVVFSAMAYLLLLLPIHIVGTFFYLNNLPFMFYSAVLQHVFVTETCTFFLGIRNSI